VKFESFELREFEVLFVSGAALLIEFNDVAVPVFDLSVA
jgi:hypothetical protein